jgi:hypothetical protein
MLDNGAEIAQQTQFVPATAEQLAEARETLDSAVSE